MERQPSSSASRPPAFLRAIREEAADLAHELGDVPINVDMEFLGFLRVMSSFGVFRYGPITIAVAPVEAAFRRDYEISGPPGVPEAGRAFAATGADVHDFFTRAWLNARAKDHKSVSELDYLLAFMECESGLPRRVFSELGISPDQVRAFAEREGSGTQVAGGTERLYSPEEAANYFGVRVETVRSWIRSGKLPAARLAGLKSIRIRERDLAAVLEPIQPGDIQGHTESTQE